MKNVQGTYAMGQDPSRSGTRPLSTTVLKKRE